MRILAAEHLLPVSSSPISDGAVAIEGGTIAAVGVLANIVDRFPGAAVESFGNAAIFPGLVNCHSHLEVTSMRGALDDVEHEFSEWLVRLSAIRESLSDAEIRHAAVVGAREGARGGVTCFGDIGRYGIAGLEALKTVGLRGVVFQETGFSPEDATADDDFSLLIEKFERLRESETSLVKIGLSPHSPYTVGPKLLSLIARFAIDGNVPISIHASESRDEKRLLERGDGLFPRIYEKYGVQWTSPQISSIKYLGEIGILETRPLLAHCVTVSADDIELIAATGSRVAHCPKSNAKFGHGYAPLENMLDSGIAVGLGSDSVGSNNVCDLFEESRFAGLAARNRPGSLRFITARELLETATLGGARALGLDAAIGSLEVGKAADIAVVSLDHESFWPVADIYSALIFCANGRDVVLTMVGGRDIYRRHNG